MTLRHKLFLGVLLVVGAVALARNGVELMTVVIVAAFVPAVILHEVAHAVSALAFGDDTAKQAGRVTLNPLPHIDPFGSLILPAMLAVATAGTAVFGYAKPVPVNPHRMRDPRNHQLLVSLAGPGTNIVLAVAAAVLFRSLELDYYDDTDVLTVFVRSFGIVNVVLAVFNLLPIPPLDGSAMVERVLPLRWWEPYLRFRQYSVGLLLAVVFVLPELNQNFSLQRLFDPAVTLWERLL